MNYLSVCSGVEAATVAWHKLGWKPVAFSEIEKFPSEVLAHHYPDVPNLGDMTNYKEWNFEGKTIDILVGGTPCQSFSVAGLRKGIEDPRGNLALTFCGILDKFRPKWFVWENVPGVLSSTKGRDFGSFLGAVGELGYGFSYRVLDAQNFGVPQRRRRVFVVGHLGDWKPAAEVLFESESLSWHPAKSKKARENAPGYIEGGFGAYNQSDVGGTTKASGGVLGGGSETFVSVSKTTLLHQDHIDALCARDYKGLNSDSLDKKAIVEVFETHPSDSRVKEMGDTCQSVTARWGTGGGNIPIALAENTIGRKPMNGGNGNGFTEQGPMYTLNATGVHGVNHNMAVRKLTPIECERLQGFPDDYTNIKKDCPDGHRYKAMGNSMAVPVMRWLGERINNYKE